MVTTWSRATSREWIYARAPRVQAKWPTGCTNTAATRILYLREEAVLQNKTCYKLSNCSAEAIRRSSWPIWMRLIYSYICRSQTLK